MQSPCPVEHEAATGLFRVRSEPGAGIQWEGALQGLRGLRERDARPEEGRRVRETEPMPRTGFGQRGGTKGVRAIRPRVER